MFHLISGFYTLLTQKDEYNVLILGLDNAGKSTLLESAKTKFTKGYKGLKNITTTVGLNIGHIDIDGIRLCFWDLGGQKELQILWDKYYDECHGVIYVIDGNDKERLNESKELFEKMIKNQYLSGVPILICGNKNDLTDCMSVREIKSLFQPHGHLIGRRDFMTIATSGLHCTNVAEAITWMVETLKKNAILRPPKSVSLK